MRGFGRGMARMTPMASYAAQPMWGAPAAESDNSKYISAGLLILVTVLLIIIIHHSACSLKRLFGFEKMGGYEAVNGGAGSREQMTPDMLLYEGACGKPHNAVTEDMYVGMAENMSCDASGKMAEGMYGKAQDYHAGCTPHHAYRGSHDYNLVDYKPPHLINMYPSRHAYVNDI